MAYDHRSGYIGGAEAPPYDSRGRGSMRNVIVSVAAVAASCAVAVTLSAQQVAPGDWPHFNRDKGGSRYVPLDQINTTNVARLQPAWTFAAVTEAPPAAGA